MNLKLKGAPLCLKKTQVTQFVFETTNLKRYQFPTHINDIIVDRAQASNSEVFMVYVEPGKSVLSCL